MSTTPPMSPVSPPSSPSPPDSVPDTPDPLERFILSLHRDQSVQSRYSAFMTLRDSLPDSSSSSLTPIQALSAWLSRSFTQSPVVTSPFVLNTKT